MLRFSASFSIIAFLSFFIHSAGAATKNKLIGIWQDAPVIASGWGDVYRFFESGKFIFNANQMECDKRLLEYSGLWKITENVLTLEIKSRTVLKGGKEIEATGSCGSDVEIEGGKKVKETLKQSKVIKLKLSRIKFDEEFKHSVIRLNGIRYWKHRDDPEDYQ